MTFRDEEILAVKQRFGINGISPKLNNAIRIAIQVSDTDMTVLISGESGTGKESFSKIIHQLSHRKHGQIIAINCGAIPEGTIDSELFGHERGAFTGAHEARKGYFEVTHGGTIFLDEIGELPLSTQARLLRVLEYGEFIKVGSSKILKTDVRVVTATNINLQEAVEEGKFREDLFYRLNTVPIHVPALRERGDDILLLFRKFASDFADNYRVKPIVLTEDAKDAIRKYRWPGNIRQLKNITEQISVLETNREISGEILLKYLPKESSLIPAIYKGQKSEGISERDLLYKVLFEMKKDMNDLKKVVYGMIEDESADHSFLQERKSTLENLESESLDSEQSDAGTLVIETTQPGNDTLGNDYDNNIVEDITHVAASEESLSLEEKENELIIKALQKNNNKRKYAAKDLGISERTLYRKIKQYDIKE
ncbi:sigma-54 interaction domain-containing protein [Bacteroidota bacterium]